MTSLKYQLTIAFLLLLGKASFGQKEKKNYLLAYSDRSSGQELWGFKTTSGQIAIKPRYTYIFGTDTLYDMAMVVLNAEWVAINKRDSIVLKPYIFDNGPDYLQDGLFRFVENNKIGFANSKGQKIIPAQFDFASPFKEGLASFSIGGRMEKLNKEHSTWTGGLWGFINKKGQVVIRPRFAYAYQFAGATCEVLTKNNKRILIDKQGRTIRVLPE